LPVSSLGSLIGLGGNFYFGSLNGFISKSFGFDLGFSSRVECKLTPVPAWTLLRHSTILSTSSPVPLTSSQYVRFMT
jgi:hypothetical protein